MSKVGVSLGLTVQINESSREYARPSVEITEIDPDQDVDQQINKALVATVKVWNAEAAFLYEQLVSMTDQPREALKSSLVAKLAELEGGLEEVRSLVSSKVAAKRK